MCVIYQEYGWREFRAVLYAVGDKDMLCVLEAVEGIVSLLELLEEMGCVLFCMP